MARQTNSTLKAAATVIKNETVERANTPLRVGTLLENQADSFTNKIPVVSKKTANYTLALTDTDTIIDIDSSSDNTVTIPPFADVTFEVGACVFFSVLNTGKTTFVAGTDVTIRSDSGLLSIAGQYCSAAVRKLAENEWLLTGNLI